MSDANIMDIILWVCTIVIYISSAIYAVGRLEGELNGIGKRLDQVISQMQTLERRFAELERFTREKMKKGGKEDGGSENIRDPKAYVY